MNLKPIRSAKSHGTLVRNININLCFADEATGGSMDWAKSKLDVPYTFEWELRDKGNYGFLLPADQIVPTSQETLDSIITILRDVSAALPNKKSQHL
jgi:hypothetical protein